MTQDAGIEHRTVPEFSPTELLKENIYGSVVVDPDVFDTYHVTEYETSDLKQTVSGSAEVHTSTVRTS